MLRIVKILTVPAVAILFVILLIIKRYIPMINETRPKISDRNNSIEPTLKSKI
jgi:hypothetical protein